MIRSKQVPAKDLDATLVALQENGSKIWNVYSCPVNMKGQSDDVGKGQSNWGLSVEIEFMITYLAKE